MTQAIEQKPSVKNIFPLHLIKVAEDSDVMVEVKCGDSYHGTLKGVDKFMNIKLIDAILTSAKGQKFFKTKEVYIRGNTIRYFTFDPQTIEKIEKTKYVAPQKWKSSQPHNNNRFRKQREST